MSRPLVIAHRGASDREVENSLAAFRAARSLGADGVELDVHATKDGAIVVHHDPVVNGLPIAFASLAEIRRQKLLNGEPIPTLEGALAAIHPDLTAFVEVKGLDAHWDQQLFEDFDRSPRPDRIAVHSFDHRIIQRLGAQRPSLERGILLASYPVHATRVMKDAGASILWQSADLIDTAMVSEIHEAGGKVYAWTVDEPAQMKRLLAGGVDALCTNHADQARNAVDSLPQ